VFLDLNFTKLLVLGVVALLVFGPERLPAIAAQAGRALRELRRMAEGAKSELQENLGPEFSNFDINDLNPRHFVRKHLVDDLGSGVLFGSVASNGGAANGGASNGGGTGGTLTGRSMPVAVLSPGEAPPYDAEAT
jgi:sec-independent protein translocase protein TatB